MGNYLLKNNIWVKIILVGLISIFCIIYLSKIFPAQENLKNVTLNEFTSYLNQRIPLIMEDYQIPGANIAIIKNGSPVWSNSYGLADLEKNKRMEIDSYCRVESISKSVTAWGIMKMVQDGVIELDKPVQEYLKNWRIPNAPYSTEAVTSRLLLSNSAGMPLGTVGVIYDPKEVKPSLRQKLTKDAILRQKPGESFFYSNTGFNILELLIEEKSGRDFATYMKDEILIPLHMGNSTFQWNETIHDKIPKGYDYDGKPIPVYVYPDKASGGLFATVEDIARFVAAGMTNYNSNNVLDNKSIKKIYSPQIKLNGYYGLIYDYYGFGLFIEKLTNGNYSIAHGGQGTGWMTHFQAVPKTGDGIVLLTNSQRSWPFFGYVLRDWADWTNIGTLGIELIPLASKYMWIFIGILLFLFLLQVWRFAEDYFLDKRRFNPLGNQDRLLRSIELIISILIFGVLIWETSKQYSFLSSIFPIAYKWLGIILCLEALILLLSSLNPKKLYKCR